MDRLKQDLNSALRGFRRTPTFFVTAVAILGLGIGMSVAMFTVFRTVLVRRLPVIDQDRIVVMWTHRDPTVEFALGDERPRCLSPRDAHVARRCRRSALAGSSGADDGRRSFCSAQPIARHWQLLRAPWREARARSLAATER